MHTRRAFLGMADSGMTTVQEKLQAVWKLLFEFESY